MSTVSCPQCFLAATVIDQFDLVSDSGQPIEHVRISCPASHHFLMARDRLTEPAPVADTALAAMLKSVSNLTAPVSLS